MACVGALFVWVAQNGGSAENGTVPSHARPSAILSRNVLPVLREHNRIIMTFCCWENGRSVTYEITAKAGFTAQLQEAFRFDGRGVRQSLDKVPGNVRDLALSMAMKG